MALSRPLRLSHEALVRRPRTQDSERRKAAKDATKPGVALLDVFAGDVDVHTPETCDQVHRNEDGTERGELREDVVDLVVCVGHFDRDLREVVGVRTRENLLVMVQVLFRGQLGMVEGGRNLHSSW